MRLRRLQSFIPAVSSKYREPYHLAPLLEAFELALKGVPQFVCCSAPPRHAKTESVLHVPAFALRRNPAVELAYITYGDNLARSKARKARTIAQRVGVHLEAKSVSEWRTREGGGLVSGGVAGPLTGKGFNIVIVDDPVKNRQDAESPTMRERLVDFMEAVATTRVEPGGSVFVFGTRWHQQDLIGTLVAEKGYRMIKLPAIGLDETGAEKALWPERWPLEELHRKREKVGEFTWQSLYQQEPVPRGAAVFEAPTMYRELPVTYREAFGLDLSYSAKKKSDHSVAVYMQASRGKVYIVDMVRRQERAPAFKLLLLPMHTQHPNARWRWYAPGPETGVADFFAHGDRSVPVRALPTLGDKHTRALAYAAAWNRGDVLVPESAPWLAELLAEHSSFTGVDDPHDDIIDACVAAYDELMATVGLGDIDTEVAAPTRQNPFEAMGM